MSNTLRNIPSVNELLDSPPLKKLVEQANRNVVVAGVRGFLENLRSEVHAAAPDFTLPSAHELAERIAHWIRAEERPDLRPVVNATGILLHTGLGRAPLADAAIEAMMLVARDYASVEMELKTGERSRRVRAVEGLLRKVTGAEAAFVVNNNAAATLLTLAALAAQREVVVSRGQLIEIGGSYRLPDVMESSGAHLREVGTTNKTRLEDYARAIGPETAAIMRVHTSNFVIQGFTESTPLDAMIQLARKQNLVMIDDIGSGALCDLTRYGFRGEPRPQDSLQAGADIVLFSGDKLMGGPQCGIILGRRELVDTISRHPLARAMRVCKLTLAALAATLRLYRDPGHVEEQVPLLKMLSTPLENLRNRATRIAAQLAVLETIESAEPVDSTSYLGGGSVPDQQLPTCCVAVVPKHGSIEQLASRLREATPSICGRIQHDRLLLDLRTVFPRQDVQVQEAFQRLLPTTAATASAEEADKPHD
jgi:L-seryl-tRNA(Ser) seleniumtransferase